MKALFWAIIFIHSAVLFAQEQAPYRVYLKPGSVIESVKTKSFHKTDRGIYVFVTAIKNNRSHFYVYDKNKKPVYVADANSIIEFEKDIQLLPNVDAETTYPAPSVMHAHNKYAFFDTQFNFHLDNMQSSKNYELPYALPTGIIAKRFELRTLYTSELPVNFGFTMNYQTATWEVENIETVNATLSILSFGPQIQRYVYEEDNMAISILLGGEYAPIYSVSTGELKDKYTGVLFNVGAEFLWKTDLGKWSLGAHYRRHDLTLQSSPMFQLEGIQTVPENIVINSIGGMLGYKYEWDL
jgi:hypothetical protein